MPLLLVDSHAHVQFTAYDGDREAVMQRALELNIGMVNVGTQYSTSADAIRLAGQYADGVWATAGFHPNHLDAESHHDAQELRKRNEEVFDYEKLLELARHPKVVAVGECGLDYHRIENHESGIKERQREIFKKQIELALEVDKPLVIHCRNAFGDLVPILDSYFMIHASRPNGVVHFFSGSWKDAERLLGLGFYLGFGGVITFARDYNEVITKVPIDRILVETDAPYVAPVPYRGKRNEPAYIIETAKKIAELRGVALEEVATVTTANAKAVLGI